MDNIIAVDRSFSPGRYTPVNRLLIANLFRKFYFKTYKSAFAVFTVAHVVLAKQQRVLPPTFKTRNFQRAQNMHRVANISDIRDVVSSTLSQRNVVIIRPFSIDIQRAV